MPCASYPMEYPMGTCSGDWQTDGDCESPATWMCEWPDGLAAVCVAHVPPAQRDARWHDYVNQADPPKSERDP